MDFAATIRQLRDRAGLSQQDVADGVGIARATYVKIESGGREPKLDEIRSISRFYEVSVSDLVSPDTDGASFVSEPTAVYKVQDEPDIIPRDINPQVNPEKLREVLLYVLEKVGAKPNVGETVLYKLLYFIDFDYYEKTGRSITGLTYVRNHYGPTPTRSFVDVVKQMEANDELEVVSTKFFNNTQKKYLPNVKSDLHDLSAKELEHINETLARLSDKTATELSELSHYDTPWRVAKQGEPINYRFVFYRTGITAVTEPTDEL